MKKTQQTVIMACRYVTSFLFVALSVGGLNDAAANGKTGSAQNTGDRIMGLFPKERTVVQRRIIGKPKRTMIFTSGGGQQAGNGVFSRLANGLEAAGVEVDMISIGDGPWHRPVQDFLATLHGEERRATFVGGHSAGGGSMSRMIASSRLKPAGLVLINPESPQISKRRTVVFSGSFDRIVNPRSSLLFSPRVEVAGGDHSMRFWPRDPGYASEREKQLASETPETAAVNLEIAKIIGRFFEREELPEAMTIKIGSAQ